MTTETHSNEVLATIYQQRFGGAEKYRAEVWRHLCEAYFQEALGGQLDGVVDVGCGYGVFINNIKAERKYGIDLNPDSKAFLNEGVTFLQQPCQKPWPLEDESIDAVFTSNFFEHLPNKETLSRTLLEARRCLRPGGRIMAMGPNINVVNGRYWDFYDHHVALSEKSMAEGLSITGFEIEKEIARFVPYTMVGQPKYPASVIRLYLAMPFAWRFFGGQFLVAGRKLKSQKA